MKQFVMLVQVMLASIALAATGSSPEFRLDLRGLGPWQRHTARASEPLTYSSAWATNAPAGAKAVVKVMPVLKTKPKYLVIDLSGGTSATHYSISYLDEVPGGNWSDEYKTSKLVLRHIPAGSFIMGGRATDYPGAVNTNLHMVTITRDFYMGVFEVTQRQWELVMGTRPSAFSNETCYATRPVELVKFVDVRGSALGLGWPINKEIDSGSFLGRLRLRTGNAGFDLPTEAQWEYACRAGTSTALHSGKNITDASMLEEAYEVARFGLNSGWVENGRVWSGVFENCTSELGTAIVGSYDSNSLGLHDMHGNVWELCLDRVDPDCLDIVPIDPVGVYIETDKRAVRSGSFQHSSFGELDKYEFVSGYRRTVGRSITDQWNDGGFRLCLQGGDVPDFAAASTLVNESGTGSQSWTPNHSGAYYLTHSVMNGTTNVQLQSAWFEVPGCELTLEPQGELTNGVSVAITGAGEGWTVYYTTNGLAPSAASEKYTGPFSLPESATVRAVAYNAQGVASEEATTSFTLHDALSVVGAVARPRYPWNGLVDIDCEIKGDPEAKYEVEVEVRDLEGGTNIEVRTVMVGRSVPERRNPDTTNVALDNDFGGVGHTALPPGTYRLVWNADADIACDHDFPQVAVTVKATKQSVLAGYARQFDISTDGYAGSETLTGVPVLVRLSTAIDGFDYRDFASPSNGADLAFFDANENELHYEIDEWHTNGESLVWVKLPELKKGMRFNCAYGNDSSIDGRAQDIAAAKHEVWREYAGVWHMNEDSGTAFDSTEHGLDALPSCGTNKLADISQMVAYENGACGRARVNATVTTDGVNGGGNYMLVPSYDSLFDEDKFVVSGWIHANQVMHNPRLWSRKGMYKDLNGWEVELYDSPTKMLARGSYGEDDKQFEANCSIPSVVDGWVQIVVCYQGAIVMVYTNGVLDVSTNTVAVVANGRNLSFGSDSNGDESSLNGQYDEIRLRGGSLSADRIKADYDMIADRAFCTYGVVKKGAGE